METQLVARVLLAFVSISGLCVGAPYPGYLLRLRLRSNPGLPSRDPLRGRRASHSLATKTLVILGAVAPEYV